ncbi:MAG: dUTPase [Gammaproteobacteria bacterium]
MMGGIMTPNNTNNDMLQQIFAMQTELNDYVFKKNKLTGPDGKPLTMQAIFSAVNDGELQVNALPNIWLSNYNKAMYEEVLELQEELPWKWWSKDDIDIQNIRVELIDILHFLVSAMISAGLTPDKVCDIYRQKHAVNVNRQDTGYSKASKTEDDNKQIG